MLHTYNSVNCGVKLNDGLLEVKKVQDVGGVIEACNELRNNEDKHQVRKEEFHHYARIPVIFVEQWMRENNITTMGKEITEIMFKKVNSDFSAFKATNTYEKGRIIG
jgi:hypothetical protein